LGLSGNELHVQLPQCVYIQVVVVCPFPQGEAWPKLAIDADSLFAAVLSVANPAPVPQGP